MEKNILRDTAKEYIEYELKFGEERKLYHYNCAEVMVNTCNDYYNLGLDKKALKMMVPFGAGIGAGKTCGILTGGMAAIGVMFSEDKPTKNLKMKEARKRWLEEFEREFKDIDCISIKEINLRENEGCSRLILKGMDILEKILNDNLTD